MIGIALLHGWGLGPETWRAWLPAFAPAPVAVLGAGHHGPSRLAPTSPFLPPNSDGWVGIGHSQGFARLAAMAVPWRGLVGVGAFLHFCPTPAHPAGTPREVLDAMLLRLQADPADVLARFRRRCGLKGLPPPAHAPEDLERLRSDLAELRDLDAAPPACPTLLLHSLDDRIAPMELGREAASRIPGARLVELQGGGHALPLTRAGDCLPHVLEFLRGLG